MRCWAGPEATATRSLSRPARSLGCPTWQITLSGGATSEREIPPTLGEPERTVLTVLGGWELVRAQVNFNSFTDAGPDAEWAGADTY